MQKLIDQIPTAEHQLRKLRRSLLFVLIIFLVPFAGIIWQYQHHINQAQEQRILDDALANALRTQSSFEQVMQVATSHVGRIEIEFQEAMHRAPKSLQNTGNETTALTLPTKEWQEQFGTLFLRSKLQNLDISNREVYGLLSVLPSIRAAHQTHQYFQWTSYYSNRGDLLGLYPFVSLEELETTTRTQSQDAVLDAIIDDVAEKLLFEVGPEKNPERRYLWTQPYFDNGGKGAMITVIAPQYFDRNFVGAMTTDLSLHLFDHSLKDDKRRLGHIIVSTDSGEVIADDRNLSINGERILRSEEVMPQVIYLHSKKKAKLRTSGFQSFDGWRYLALPINNNQWQLHYFFSEEELQKLEDHDRKETVWGIFILMSVLALAAAVIIYLFALPSIRLLQFLIALEQGTAPIPSKIPKLWRHTFEQISKTNAERSAYLLALTSQANQLEEMVEARTKELTHQRELAEKARNDIAIISDSGRQITASLEMNEIAAAVHRHLSALVPLESFSIGTLDRFRGEIAFSLVLSDNQLIPPFSQAIDDLDPGQQKAIVTCEEQISVSPSSNFTSVSLPLVLHGDCIGIICLTHQLSRDEHNNALNLIRSLAAYVAIAFDNAATVKRLQKTQDKLMEREKLAALGSIVVGVAHELNTPIGNALLTASSFADITSTIKFEIDGNQVKRSSLLRYSDQISTACSLLVKNLESAAQLISNFKQIAVDQSSDQRRVFSLWAVTQEIVSTFESRIKRGGHHIQLNIDKSLELNSFPGPYTQAIGHLISNALEHAFNNVDHGQILIQAVYNKELEEISLLFQDNGCGIETRHLSHVFEPFYTTKLGHGGSGLGLHISYNIVTAVLGGAIEVSSQVGAGTKFQIKLPRNPHPSTEIRD